MSLVRKSFANPGTSPVPELPPEVTGAAEFPVEADPVGVVATAS
jgi:hypothetical protein